MVPLVIFLLLVMVASGSTNLYDCYNPRVCNGLSHLHWLSQDRVLAFRLTPGIQKSAYDAYVDKSRDDDHPLARVFMPPGCLQNFGDCDGHYHSSVLNHWPSRYVEKVKENWYNVQVSLYKGKQRVAFTTFNGTKSNSVSWFSENTLIDSSWMDIKYFYSGQNSRRFFMFRNYGGCQNDAGWMTVLDQLHDGCTWGSLEGDRFPAILYSNQNTYTRLSVKNNLMRADVLTVEVELKLPCKQ